MRNQDEYRIPLEKLKKACSCEDELNFCTTSADAPELEGIVGQERAVRAMDFGLAMEADGYNIFVVGEPGTGKSSYTGEVISQLAAGSPVPDDWCYVYNFKDKDKPEALRIPAGRGREFQHDMDKLVADVKSGARKAFESSEYELKRNRIFNDIQEKMEELYRIIEQKAFEDGFSVKQEGLKFVFVPILYGRPMLPDEFGKLSEKEHQQIEAKRRDLGKHLDKILYDGHLFEKRISEQVIALDKETVVLVAQPLIQQLKEKYSGVDGVIRYLDLVLADIGDNSIIFKKSEILPSDLLYEEELKSQEAPAYYTDAAGNVQGGQQGVSAQPTMSGETEMEDANAEDTAGALLASGVSGNDLMNLYGMNDAFTRYKVNLFINNENLKGAPVIIESNPFFYSVFGKIEYKSQILVMSTDFTMVKPGAIHQANGGYLILQAKDILMDPFVWDTLKKALKYRKAEVENIGEQYRTVPTVTLRPEPIPLNVKVVLVGSPLFYMILSADEDFQKLFKIKVDFDSEMPRTPENIRKYVSFVSSICKVKKARHFSRAALAVLVEQASRMAEDQNKLSAKFDEVSEIIYESSAWAKTEGSDTVEVQHVKKAIKERRYRLNKIEEKLQEGILHKKIIIDVEGNAIGQINGLFIVESEGFMFGLPARITAITHVGRGGVINIERETEMSGNIHSKGVLTLAGYLAGKLAQKKPLGFTAQVTFEQLYEGVEGDSASSAELYAVISSLAGVSLSQSIAVTGSVDQRGEIQPIGAVNEKIEGFFDICVANGLTGKQGVIIPERNIDNLMLKDEVIEAVRSGMFNIYAISRVEEGLEILTGVTAGEAGEDGKYPDGSIFNRVSNKLEEYSKAFDTTEQEEADEAEIQLN